MFPLEERRDNTRVEETRASEIEGVSAGVALRDDDSRTTVAVKGDERRRGRLGTAMPAGHSARLFLLSV